MKSILYAEHTWEEIKEAAKEDKVILLPMGSIEEHGPHLPLETDSLTAYEISKRAALKVPDIALVMPPVYYTYSETTMDFPGTIDVEPNHMMDYLFDICKSLTKHGFRRIILVGGHGLNAPFLFLLAQRVTNNTQAICCGLSYWEFAREKIAKIVSHAAHACEFETSLVLALKKEAVYMDKAVKDMDIYMNIPNSRFVWRNIINRSPIFFLDRFSTFSKTGICGDPTLATEEKGKEIIEAITDEFAEFIKEFKSRPLVKWVDHH
ncbi:MAG: creatininase family protein [Nitrososphaerales archaeon]